MYYLTVSTDDVLNTTNNEKEFTELRRFFEEAFEIKSQEGYVLKYFNFSIFHSRIGFSTDQTEHIRGLVIEWFPTEYSRKIGTTFLTVSTYKQELMDALTLTGNALCK